jgi:hypothetical protein
VAWQCYQQLRSIYHRSATPVGERWATVVWGGVTLYGIIGWMLRELADLVAFADYEPWWKAGRQWLTGFEEEPCRICQQSHAPKNSTNSIRIISLHNAATADSIFTHSCHAVGSFEMWINSSERITIGGRHAWSSA